MSDHLLLAQYTRQPHVRDRNLVGLVAWAVYQENLPIPSNPNDAWIRERVVAERIPLAPTSFVDRTIAFFLQDPSTVTNVREHLNPWNASATEEALSLQIGAAIAAFMPRFALADVSDDLVTQWRVRHGLTAS